jgi:hypothetical protein
MTFKLEINTDNAAFDGAPLLEVARMLRDLASHLEDAGDTINLPLYDVNGNRVGFAVLANP